MTTTPNPDAADPAWKALCDSIATITDPGWRDLAGDALCEAYSLGIARGVDRGHDLAMITLNASKNTDTAKVASGSGSSRRAQDEPKIELIERVVERARAKYWTEGMTDEEFVAGVLAVLDIDGHLERYPNELRDRRTEDLNLRGTLSPNGYGRLVPMELGESIVPAVEWLVAEVNRFRGEHDAACQTIAAMHAAAVGEVRGPIEGVVEDVAAVARRAAMLGPVLRWRDHTAAILDNLVRIATTDPVNLAELRRAGAAAREVLQLDPEKASGVPSLVEREDQADECEGAPDPVNASEQPEDTVRRYAGEIWRLASGLADRAIPLADGSIDTAPVTTALAALDRLVETLDGLTWRAGVRHNELRLLREERRRFLHQLAELQQLIATPKLATAPAAFNPLCTCGHSKGRHTWNGAGCEFCMSCAAYAPIPRADLAESNMDGDR